MKRARFNEEQIISILKEAEAGAKVTGTELFLRWIVEVKDSGRVVGYTSRGKWREIYGRTAEKHRRDAEQASSKKVMKLRREGPLPRPPTATKTPGVLISTHGKSRKQIVEETVRALRRRG